ncbi:MAG: sugar kinase [Nitratireductor sp.]|nr:sugar kinase [Nitratireductor sp.]
MKPARKLAIGIGEAMIEMAPVGQGLYRRGFAGDTFNTVWHMAQALGDQARIGYICRVGTDKTSDRFVMQLANDGLETTGITRDPQRGMGIYLIELDGVERSFQYWRSASAARLLAEDLDLLNAALGKADLIHLSGITLAIISEKGRANLFDVLAKARRRGAKVSLDPNIRLRLWGSADEMRKTISMAMSCADIALPSFDDERTHWGDVSPQATIACFALAGVPEIIVKNGEQPVVFQNVDRAGELETPLVTDIKDTTGAGDAFNAGYLAARMTGHDMKDAIGHGQVMAAEVLRNYGARIAKDKVPLIWADESNTAG